MQLLACSGVKEGKKKRAAIKLYNFFPAEEIQIHFTLSVLGRQMTDALRLERLNNIALLWLLL